MVKVKTKQVVTVINNLDKLINDFIDAQKIQSHNIIDIKYAMVISASFTITSSALIIYREGE